jgi:hypothetical protein
MSNLGTALLEFNPALNQITGEKELRRHPIFQLLLNPYAQAHVQFVFDVTFKEVVIRN